MNCKNYKFIITYKSDFILILISWITIYKLNPKIIIFFIPVSIFQFLYSHRNYKIDISELTISLYSIFKSKQIIEIKSIKEISIDKERDRYSFLGAKQNIIIQLDSKEVEFNIYKFKKDEILSKMNQVLENKNIRVMDFNNSKEDFYKSLK